METIKITSLERKGTMLVVGIEGKKEHTMNTGWQEQLVDYIEKDVGVGGSVSVEMVDKPDKNNPSKMYHNITDVDLTSAKKGTNPVRPEDITWEKDNSKIVTQEPSRDDKIVAQVFVKCAAELAKNKQAGGILTNEALGEYLCMAVIELHGAYKVALNALNPIDRLK